MFNEYSGTPGHCNVLPGIPKGRLGLWSSGESEVLLRYPAKTLPDEAGSFFADRCHSLWSLHLPQAALPSLPIRKVLGRSLVLSCEKESTLHIFQALL